MGVDHLMKPIDLIFLNGQDIVGFSLLGHQLPQFFLQSSFGSVVFILHGENVLIDGDLILQEIVKLVDALPLHDFLIDIVDLYFYRHQF